jgi:hypothetical protein
MVHQPRHRSPPSIIQSCELSGRCAFLGLVGNDLGQRSGRQQLMTAVIQIVAHKGAISKPECEPVEHDRTSDAAAAHLTTCYPRSVREQKEATRADASSEAGVSLALLRLARRRQLDVKH